MPTRIEKRRLVLQNRKKFLEDKIWPIHREIALVDGELELLDQYEAAEISAAQEKLGIATEDVIAQTEDR
jgi:hypothetical protein